MENQFCKFQGLSTCQKTKESQKALRVWNRDEYGYIGTKIKLLNEVSRELISHWRTIRGNNLFAKKLKNNTLDKSKFGIKIRGSRG